MKYLAVIIGVLALVAICAYVYNVWKTEEPVYLDPSATLEGVGVQPAEAIALAEPHLEERATVVFNDDEPLKTHIVSYEGWYYVMRTNYPAKTFRYYLQLAVKVHMETGEVAFSEKN